MVSKEDIDRKYILSVKGKEFITFAGLLDVATKNGLQKLVVKQLTIDAERQVATCIVDAEFFNTDKGTRVFSGVGSGTMDNCSDFVKAHWVEMAHTRANARALRNALNIDMVGIEELGKDEFDEKKVVDMKSQKFKTRDSSPFHKEQLM